LENVTLGTAPSFSSGLDAQLEELEQRPAAWKTILELEEQAYCLPGLHDAGEFMLAKGVVHHHD
jgi:hypothetical protein